MIRLTNEQRLQSIEFYCQNAYSDKKVHRCFFHFKVRLIDPLKLLFELLWLNFAPNLHCWTLNYQHAYVECELVKISQLYRPVSMMIINYRFIAARSNLASVTQQRAKFCRRIFVWNFSKYSWCKNWSRTTYRNAEFLVNGLLESWTKIHFFIEKLCSVTKLILGLMDT